MTGKFDFETRVNRENTGNMKGIITPEAVKTRELEAFNAAEMDFRTAPSVIQAVKDFADNGVFGFTLCDDKYRDAVCWWMKEARGISIKPEWIQPTMGTIYSLATCIRMCVQEGENIIVQPPVYNRYKQAADRIERGTVYNYLLRREDGSYEIDIDDLEIKMSNPDNKLLVICNPQNPTGSVWSREILEKIAELAVRYDVIVYSDEIFADYTFGEHDVTMYCTVNEGRNNGISATSLGKAFSFTGVNHANMLIADPELRERFERQKYRDHYGSLEPMVRAALLGAYSEEGLAWRNDELKLLERNEAAVRKFFAESLPAVVVSPLEGSYVMWLDWRGLGGTWEEIRKVIYEEALFVLEDGTDFCIEDEGFTRMNIATPESVVSDAILRLASVIAKL